MGDVFKGSVDFSALLNDMKAEINKLKTSGESAGEAIGVGFEDGFSDTTQKIKASSIKLSGLFNNLKNKISKETQQLSSSFNGQNIKLKINFADVDMDSDKFKDRVQSILNNFSEIGAIEFDTKGSQKNFENLISLYVKYSEKLHSLQREMDNFDSSSGASPAALTKNLQEQLVLAKEINKISTFLQNQTDVGIPVYAEDYTIRNANKYLEILSKINKESNNFSSEKTGGFTGNSLAGVVEQLEEIKNVIKDIKTAFEPLTKSLSAEDSALHKMLTTSIDDLNTLESRLKDVYQMIDTISKKEFNISTTNVLQQTVNNPASAFKEQKNEALELVKICKTYYDQLVEINKRSKAFSKAGMLPKDVLDFESYNADEILSGLRGARSQKQLDAWSSSAEDYKAKILEVLQLLHRANLIQNDVKDITVPKKQNENVINADKVEANVNGVLSEVKSIRDKINDELQGIRAEIANVFQFDNLNPNYDAIKNITDTIYQQFLDLQAKINTLDLRLGVPTVVPTTSVSDKEGAAAITAGAIRAEAEAMQNVQPSADGAAKAKENFNEANKKAAEGAKKTQIALEAEQQEFKETANAAKDAAQKINSDLDKIKDVENIATGVTSHTEEKTTDYNTRRVTTVRGADDEVLSETVTIINNLKARRQAAEQEATKIKKAMADVQEYIARFDSKTNNMGKYLKGYDDLNNFKITNLDQIDEAVNSMIKLETEYNKVTKSFRQGTKSMNPFVNAITGIDEMGNKVKDTQLNFDKLVHAPEDLANEVARLNPLLEKMKSFISKDESGNTVITNIYGLAKAYGDLNVVLRKSNSDIALRSKIEAAATKEGAQTRRDYEAAIKQQDRLYKAKKQLASVNSDSLEGRALSRRVKELEAEYTATINLLDGKTALVAIRQREADLQQELSATVSEKARSEQVEKLLSVYRQYADLRDNVARMDNDTSGKVYDQERAAAIRDMADAAKRLKDSYGIDVSSEENFFNSLSRNQILTQEQMIDLLDDDIKRRQTILNLMRRASDAESTRLKKEQQKQENKNQTYGKTTYNRELRHFENIDAKIKKIGDNLGGASLSPEFLEKIERYKNAFKELEELRNTFATNPDAFNSASLKGKFQAAALEVETLRKEITSTFKEAEKFDKLSASGAVFGTIPIDPNRFTNAKSAMIDFAATITDGKFKLEGFNAAGTEMYGTLTKGEGVVEKVTIALRSGTNQLYAYRAGTREVSSSWNKLGKSLTDGVRRLAVMYFSLYDIIRYVRKGVEYVKEIDLALTELKKVTDETEATYNNFLKTASKTSAVIGSTVSDFTDATAAFARLGYSIDESSKMAETAIVYKNVADGLDTVEESTESIISTMKAYGIEANDTMGIIDRFNAVGNNFAITSAGIGDAMQRSASALYEGGNSIDESIGLITAANSVIQNPEQVGTALKTLSLRIRGVKTE